MTRILLAVVLWLSVVAPSYAEQRLALVIGVNLYPKLSQEDQLRTAVSDASIMAKSLRDLGFEVEVARNVDQTEFLLAVNRLKAKITRDATVFLFFAGHGVSLRGSNLLLPSDMPPLAMDSSDVIRAKAVAETDIIDSLQEKSPGLLILTLDACRNNPLEEAARKRARDQGRTFRSLSGLRSVGLNPTGVSGVISIYSAGFGQQALDSAPETGPDNSVFTTVFAKGLRERGRSLSSLMDSTMAEVARIAATVIDPDTNQPHLQFPAYYNQTRGGEVFLAGTTDSPKLAMKADNKTLLKLISIVLDRAMLDSLTKHSDEDVRNAARQRLASLPTVPEGVLSPDLRFVNPVWSVDVSPDGRHILSGSLTAELSMWDAESGRLLPSYTTHKGTIGIVAFSPDGRRVASADSGGIQVANLELWDIETRSVYTLFKQSNVSVQSLRFSTDGSRVYAVLSDNSLMVWDTNTMRSIRTLKLAAQPYKPDRRAQVKSSNNWMFGGMGPDPNQISASTFSFDGKRVAASHEHRLKIWDVETGMLLQSLVTPKENITAVAFSRDGQLLATGSDDFNLTLRDAISGRSIRSFERHGNQVQQIAFSADGRRLASVDGTDVKLWDTVSGHLIRRFSDHSRSVNALAFSPSGSYLVSGDGRTLKQWDIETGNLLRTMVLFPNNNFVTLLENGYFMSSPGAIDYLNVTDGTKTRPLDNVFRKHFQLN